MIQYIGIPYSKMNCADLALKVQFDLNGLDKKEYIKPKSNNPFELSKSVKENLNYYTKEISKPENYCLVLMKCKNRICHIGTYFEKNNKGYVLHTSDSFGSSIIHKVSDLKKFMITVEGYYQWI